MTRVYRLLRKPYSKKPLNGEGAFRFGGRWSSPGIRLAYCAEHSSLAMIEYYVHIDPEELPADLVLITAEIPDSVSRLRILPRQLPANWRQQPAPPGLAAIGDSFVRERRAAVLIVPSALTPAESNWLVNPRHPDYAKIHLQRAEPFRYDKWFFA